MNLSARPPTRKTIAPPVDFLGLIPIIQRHIGFAFRRVPATFRKDVLQEAVVMAVDSETPSPAADSSSGMWGYHVRSGPPISHFPRPRLSAPPEVLPILVRLSGADVNCPGAHRFLSRFTAT